MAGRRRSGHDSDVAIKADDRELDEELEAGSGSRNAAQPPTKVGSHHKVLSRTHRPTRCRMAAGYQHLPEIGTRATKSSGGPAEAQEPEPSTGHAHSDGAATASCQPPFGGRRRLGRSEHCGRRGGVPAVEEACGKRGHAGAPAPLSRSPPSWAITTSMHCWLTSNELSARAPRCAAQIAGRAFPTPAVRVTRPRRTALSDSVVVREGAEPQ